MLIRKVLFSNVERIRGYLKNKLHKVLNLCGYYCSEIYPPMPIGKNRYEYQKRFVNFDIHDGDRVLDIGSGGDPFPCATVLAERYLEPSRHRSGLFESHGKPIVICDIHRLPFKTGIFDYVYCSHVLEHVDDPIQASREIMRVGSSGYIETPHFMTDALFAWARGMHKWFVESIGNRLVFFEYNERQLEGIRSQIWSNIIFSEMYHPLQRIFVENRDIFDMMFVWKSSFIVDVYYTDGTIRRSENER